jgi:DNA repair protein RadA/Sms
MILAVLEKKAGISLLDHDVYVNVVGGMNTGSTSTDLAVALAIYSSFSGKSSKRRIVAVGEVGLTGHLRSIPNADRIVQEAARLGYEAVILPERNAGSSPHEGIAILGAINLSDAIRAYLS